MIVRKKKVRCLQNWVWDEYKDENGKWKEVKLGIPPSEIFKNLRTLVGSDWPKSVCETTYGLIKDELRTLDTQGRMFAWIVGHDITIDWCMKGTISAVSREVFFNYVKLHSSRYESIELLPHEPHLPNIHYQLFPVPECIYQGSLNLLLRMLCPETKMDAIYLKAMFLTPSWGGVGGSRPAFVLLGPEGDKEGGRGVGKSALTEILGILYGSCVDFHAKADRDTITKRLLTSASKRLIRVDNVKGKLSSDSLESLITTRNISGHRLFTGDSTIPNLFTWIITFNQPDFSKDMAQRAIPIRLGRPGYDPKWFPKVRKYVEENRWNILCDIIRILKSDATVEFTKHPRFPEWADAVLNRCTTNANVTYDIEKRQKMVEYEESLMNAILDIIEMNIDQYNFYVEGDTIKPNIETACFRIRKTVFINWITSERHNMTTNSIMRALNDDRPEWLKVDENRNAKRAQGRVVLGPTVGGTPYIEVGSKNVTQAWQIDNAWRNNNAVRVSVRTMDLTIVPDR